MYLICNCIKVEHPSIIHYVNINSKTLQYSRTDFENMINKYSLFTRRFVTLYIFNGIYSFVFQIILAIPFLLVNPWGYIIQSFNLGRQFFYIWTVNWRLVPEDLFLDKKFQLLLLACHAVCLLLFFHFKWKR